MKKNNETKNTLPKFRTLDQAIKEESASKAFRDAYNEELLRLRLAVEIKSLRLQSHLTQEGLAEQAGMPQSVIARIESGKHTISLSTLNKIASALGREIQLGISSSGTSTYQNNLTGSRIESPYSTSQPTNNVLTNSFKKYEK